MQQEICKLLVLAVACEIPSDDAYKLLSLSYIDEFKAYYANIKATVPPEECPSTVDAMINFTIIKLPFLKDGFADDSILYNLRSRRSNIIKSFLHSDVSTMVRSLAARQSILDAVRNFLVHENNFNGVYSKLNNSRISVIFTQFLEVFNMNSAHAFMFVGGFKEFVMFSFINFFYNGRKRDIWAQIRETDDAKFELEHNIITEKTLSVLRNDDLKIHDLLINITVVNDLMFEHSGQDEGVKGVMYDIYYLILCELCVEKVAEINKQLGDDILVFVDPYDRRRRWFDVIPNKGIAAKILNAKEIISYIFGYVRDGRLSMSSFADLRSHAFELGKHDREGRNCVWEDVQLGGETAHCLDNEKARRNYDSFNKILKGVISVYTLMTELESRGRFLVAEYREEIFQDKNLIRYIDYLSALEHLDLIKQLQAQEVDGTRYSSDLLEFQGMLNEYAGSEHNNSANIHENWEHAKVYGFLDKPLLRQQSIPVTDFDKLSRIARAIVSIPRGYFEYLMTLNPNYLSKYTYTSWLSLPASGVADGRYRALYYNKFMQENQGLAKYYLEGNQRLTDLGMGLFPDLRWNLATAPFMGVQLLGGIGVWLPIEKKFYFYGVPEGMSANGFTASVTDIYATVRQSTVNGVQQATAYYTYAAIPAIGCVAEWVNKMGDSIGFDVNIGLYNLTSPDIMAELPKTKILGIYRKYVDKYYQWTENCSLVQHSIIDVLKAMYSESLYWRGLGYDAGVLPAHAENLLSGLQTGEFSPDTLNWFLETLYKDERIEEFEWDPSHGETYRKLDKLVLTYCFEDVTPENCHRLYWEDLVELVKKYASPAEKFLAIYNYVCTKIEFLLLLRDSMSLMLTTIPMESSSLICEFNNKFNVQQTLLKYTQSPVKFGAKLWDQPTEDVKALIYTTRDECLASFKTLIDFFVNFIKDSEDDIAKMINYNIASQGDIASRFKSWGEIFAIMPQYDNILELDNLRTVAITDDAGFFVMNGVYFKGRNNNVEYYVHRSGRLLAEVNGKFEPLTFNFNRDKDRQLYRDILAKGFYKWQGQG